MYSVPLPCEGSRKMTTFRNKHFIRGACALRYAVGRTWTHMQIEHIAHANSSLYTVIFNCTRFLILLPLLPFPYVHTGRRRLETRHLSALADIKNVLTLAREFDKRNKNCSYHTPSSSALKNTVMHLPIQHLILPFRKKKIYIFAPRRHCYSRVRNCIMCSNLPSTKQSMSVSSGRND